MICCHVPAILKSYFPALWEEGANSEIKINGQSENMRVFWMFNKEMKVADVNNSAFGYISLETLQKQLELAL